MAKVKNKTKKTKKRKSSSGKKTSSVHSKKPFRSYKKAMDYLSELTNFEKQKVVRYNTTTFDLKRMKKLLTSIGNPHKDIDTIHIAGTKGKGSTAAMLSKMLHSNGYKVGMYVSPHIVHLHERITVDFEMISEKEMVTLMNRLYAPVEKMRKKDRPSFFEIMTAIAFLHFADNNVDVAVVETGLGGRLDSTNVIKPKVIGITSLSIDHQEQLGGTIEEIAREKAGVFKKGVPVVTVRQPEEAIKILRKEADSVNASLEITGEDIDFSYRFEASREYGPHTRICLTTPTSKFEHLRVPLHGTHQAINCSLALAILDKLKGEGFDIDGEKATKGLSDIQLSGRMEMICYDPRVLIDAAHNAASIKALVHAVGQHIPYDSMVIIFGCNEDKDVRGMLEQLQYGADKVIFTRSSWPKAVSPDELGEMYSEISGKMYQTASCLSEALQLAQNAVGREDLICITGSIYLIGQAKKRIQPESVKIR
jgi:dihydrofolate synthase/folylpolyglutamate synthase